MLIDLYTVFPYVVASVNELRRSTRPHVLVNRLGTHHPTRVTSTQPGPRHHLYHDQHDTTPIAASRPLFMCTVGIADLYYSMDCVLHTEPWDRTSSPTRTHDSAVVLVPITGHLGIWLSFCLMVSTTTTRPNSRVSDLGNKTFPLRVQLPGQEYQTARRHLCLHRPRTLVAQRHRLTLLLHLYSLVLGGWISDARSRVLRHGSERTACTTLPTTPSATTSFAPTCHSVNWCVLKPTAPRSTLSGLAVNLAPSSRPR